MNTKHNTPFDITVELEGVQIQVTVHITPLVRGKWTDKNGDPGWPDEGGEIVIVHWHIRKTDDYMFLKKIYKERLSDEIESLTHKTLNP